MEFTDSATKIVRLNIGDDMARELLASLILVNLGKSRLSSNIISRQVTSYEKELPQVIDTLNKMKDITRQMVVRVLAGDVKELGVLLSEEWVLKRSLDKHISNSMIDRFHDAMIKHGAIGGKLVGAGEGGHMLFLSDLSKRAKLLEFVGVCGFHYVPFNFDNQGVQAWAI
ncbi:MAG: hypothetical protein HY376_03615 [Candidatus Blackburnbacteria bacterium]|nr:hypothetical protein [Candidatus Blackburnbacteria bacterium]